MGRSGSSARTSGGVCRPTSLTSVGALADVDRQKAKFDRSDPRVKGTGAKRAKDAFDEALSEPPGSPPPDAH